MWRGVSCEGGIPLAMPLPRMNAMQDDGCMSGHVFHAGIAGEDALPNGSKRHLCIFVHGMAGCSQEFETWMRCLKEEVPTWTLHALKTLEQFTRPIIGGNMRLLASQVAKEIAEVVQHMSKRSPEQAKGKNIVLHCIGHSMGGIAVRGALPELFGLVPDIEPGTYMALSTPLIGIRAGPGAPTAFWRNLSCLTASVSPQLPQLAVQDGTSTKRPYLIELADPDGEYIQALALFKRRICVAMKQGDIVIPTASGALWGDQSWSTPNELVAGAIAGWGYEAISGPASSKVRTTSYCSVFEFEESVRPPVVTGAWDQSADKACVYPRDALQGLLTLDWTRIVVKLQLPKATVHVFLLGKESDQSQLERVFSQDCVKDLCKLVAEGQDLSQTGAWSPWLYEKRPPLWHKTVDGRACSPKECKGKWSVATEEGIGNVICYTFPSPDQARFFFNSFLTTSRILFDEKQNEQGKAGANLASFSTIRRKFLDGCQGIGMDACTSSVRNVYSVEVELPTMFREDPVLRKHSIESEVDFDLGRTRTFSV